MPTTFAKAFIKKASKSFPGAKGHKHRTGKSFGNADIPDGTYTAVVTAETGVVGKGKYEGVPTVRFRATVAQGPHEGQEPSKVFFCEGKPIPTDPDEFPTAEQQLIGLLEFLLPDIQIDDIEQVEQAIELVNDRGPMCLVGIRNRSVNGKSYQDVFFNKVIKETSFDSPESNLPEAEAANDPETTSQGNGYVPAKGDIVSVDGLEGDFEVLQVSQSKQTANLEASDGSRRNGVLWDSLQPV